MDKDKDLLRAVNWKVEIVLSICAVTLTQIFEVQAALISDDALDGHMVLAKKWLLPSHFRDIVEERSTNGLCGFPTCREPLRPNSIRARRIEDEHFCSETCTDRAKAFVLAMDTSPPVARDAAKTLPLDTNNGIQFPNFVNYKHAN